MGTSTSPETVSGLEPSILLYAPTGALIVAACELVRCTSHLHGFVLGPDGKLEPEYENGCEVDWDSQCPRTNEQGEALFLDDDCRIWPFSALVRTAL